MNVLILITANYPYGHGEQFLEYEIPNLSGKFDKILIIPASPTDKTSCRSIPENIELVDLEISTPVTIASILSFFLSVANLKECFFLLMNSPINKIWLNIKVMLKNYGMAKSLSNSLKIISGKIPGRKIFYSYWLDEYALGLVYLKRTSKKGDIKIVSRAHGWDVYFERHPGKYLPFRRELLKSLNRLFFISEHGRDYLLNKTGTGINENIRVSRLGTTGHEKIYPANTELRIFSCSSIIALKRIHLIIESLALVEHVQVIWHHAGSGPLHNEIRQLANEKLSSKKNIKFNFLGQVPNRELPDFYRKLQLELFINVSEFEGIPVSVMEAMSFGVPVIATHVGGVGEIVNKSNGFLLPANVSPKEIAIVIENYFKLDESSKKNYRENAWKTWNEKFNAEKNFNEFADELINLK